MTILKLACRQFADKRASPSTAVTYECWSDPADNGITLTKFQNVHALRQ